MGLGILDDHKLEHVPGTANVFEGKRPGGETVAEKGAGIVNGNGSANGRMGGWKYDKTGKILLVPQPSEDPNDPLNWPLWHRDLILFVLSFASILASTLSPLLAADTASLAILFTRTFTEMALLTGYHLLAVGLAGFLFVPSARIWGKRHLYVLGTLIVVISSFWGGGSGTNYKSLLWARVFQGIGLAPFEALVNASVGDMYFVHERGARMAVSNLALFGGAFFTPVLVGKIAATMGWEWTFWFVGIFMAVGLVGVVFWCPETTYKRDSRFEIDTMGNFVETRAIGRVEGSVGSSAEAERGLRAEKPVGDETVHENGTVLPAKATWKQSLALFNGRKSEERYLHLLLRPFSLFLHPGILWACLIQGTLIGWTVLIGIVLSVLTLGPPLWFTEVENGYMYTGAFIGALLGFALCGLLSDWSAKKMTGWNNGVYEPEFRLVLVVPQLVLGCAGLYGFGWCAQDVDRLGNLGWVAMSGWFGVEVAGMVCGAVASALYVVDGYRDMSVEGFTCLLVFKNIFSFGLTFKGFEWMVQGGVKHVFVIIASVQVAICALTIPMYVFGKKNRSFFHRHNVFFKTTDAIATPITRVWDSTGARMFAREERK